jgi:hypothetical protein
MVRFPQCVEENPMISWSGQQAWSISLFLLKVLLGTSHFNARRVVIHFRRVERLCHCRLVGLPLPQSPICLFFLLGVYLILSKQFLHFELLLVIRWGCYINKARWKPLSRKYIVWCQNQWRTHGCQSVSWCTNSHTSLVYERFTYINGGKWEKRGKSRTHPWYLLWYLRAIGKWCKI